LTNWKKFKQKIKKGDIKMKKAIEELQHPQTGFEKRFTLKNVDITEAGRDLIAHFRKIGQLQYAVEGIDFHTTTIITSEKNYTAIATSQ